MSEAPASIHDSVATNGRRAGTVPAGYKHTDVGVIPEDWKVSALRDVVVKFVNGGTPSTRNESFWSGAIPWITGADILSQRVAVIRRWITEEAVRGSSTSVIGKGNLLIVSRTGVGKLAIAPCDIAISQDFTGVVPNREKVLADFLFRFFVHDQNVLTKQNQGTSIKGITRNVLAVIPIPLPPLREQRAIAEALSDVDGLLESLDALIAKKQAIKKATMQQLLTGKTRLPGFRGAWETKRIGEICDVDPEVLPSSTNPNLTFNYISLEQVDAGRLLAYSEERFCTAPSRARRVLRYGDVLMSTVRPSLMAHLLYREQIPNAVCSTGFAVLRARARLADPSFLFFHLLGKVVNKQIENSIAGSNYPAISGRDVRLLEIPCPPHDREQRAIGAVLTEMDAEIAALEQRREKTRVIKNGMMQQLLTGQVRLI